MGRILFSAIAFTAGAGLLCAQATIGGCPVLPSNNIWNTPVDKLPAAANSGTLVNTIGPGKYVHADFGSGLWNGGPIGIPFITVTGAQAKYPATFLYDDESDPGPYAVPMNAPIEGGSQSTGDRHAIAVDTTNCILYELYASYPQGSAWKADSGAIYDLRSNALRPSGWTSADAAGLPIVPGLVTWEEVASGEIRHAIRFTAPQTRRAFVWPARHYASSLTGAQYPRMGERFRLKASFEISGFPAEVQVILKAMKKYGVILADNGSAWYISGKPDERWNNDNLRRLHEVVGSDFEAVDATGLMVAPDSGEARQSTTAVRVEISPNTPQIYVGRNQQFTAAVTGTSNAAVKWSVDGVEGGSAARGFIGPDGLYMAPTALPAPPTVTVKAVAVADASAQASTVATVTPLPNITSVSPNPVTAPSFTITAIGVGFRAGAVLRFHGGALATTVLSATQVRATGTVAASAVGVPVVVSNPDGVSSNTAYVNVTLPPPATVAVTVSPAVASVRQGAPQQFVAAVTGTADKRVAWKVNGVTGGGWRTGTISAAGLFRAPRIGTGSKLIVTVTAVSLADPKKTASARVTVTR